MSEYKTACPHCASTDAYTVYPDGHGYCYSCEKYDKTSLVDDAWEAKDPTPPTPPTPSGPLLKPAIKPLTARKILKKICQRYGYGYADGCHVATYQSNGQDVAQHFRTKDKDFFWKGPTKHLELFGQHLWQPGGKLLVITEGEIDCLTIAQALNLKVPVVSLPSGAQSGAKYIKQNLKFVESFRQVIIAFDTDEPGTKAAKQCAQLLKVGKAKIATYNGFKDANELLLENRGAELPECVFKAKPYRPDGIVLGSDIPLSMILEKPEPGLMTPYGCLNEMTLGMHKKRLYLVTAGSGIGKSTLAKELGFDILTNHKERLGIMAWEESLKQSAEGIISLDLNIPLHIRRPDDKLIAESYQRVINQPNIAFDQHWGSSDIETVLTKIRYLVRGLDMDWIIVDHVSIVVSGNNEIEESERKQLDMLMTNLRTVIEETGVGIIAICHLKRPGMGKSWNEGRQVSLTDLRGSAALEQIPDFVISLEGDQQGDMPNIRIMRVLKNRLTGKVGVADTLEYNPTTGRLLPYQEGAWNGQEVQIPNDF